MVVTIVASSPGTRRTVFRATDAGLANTLLNVSVDPTQIRANIFFITIKYSERVKEDVTITLNSGVGAAFDTLLETIPLSQETDAVWIPDNEIFLMDDDTLNISAPAGGAGITCAIAVYHGVDAKK